MNARNILLFTVDDMNWDTPAAWGGCYGPATPNIDAFADEARCFRHAHVTVAVCLPSRSAIMTGRYPHHNGSEGFTAIHPDVPTMPEVLKDHGWRTGIIGKVKHCCPPAKFRWDHQCDYEELAFGRSPQRYAEEVDGFLDACGEQPFFLMVNSHDPHRPFHGSDQERNKFSDDERASMSAPSRAMSPEDVSVPGFLPDLPEIRREVAEYASSCRRADDTFAATRDCLRQRGLWDQTVVVFLSDNGMAFPFAKANCYLHSTRTPLMIRWPGVSQPGMDEMHMVNGIDLLPTLFEGLGIPLPPDVPRGAMLEPLNEARELWRPIPPQIDGRSCFELLAGGTSASHEHLHTEFHRTHGNSNFEMRCVQTREWGYIYNAWAQQNKWYRNESCSGRTFNAMKAAAESDPAIAERVTMFVHRVPEELYNFKADPDALRNCVDDPEAQSVLMDMRSRMRNWMQDTGDTLVHMYDRHLDAANGHTALRK